MSAKCDIENGCQNVGLGGRCWFVAALTFLRKASLTVTDSYDRLYSTALAAAADLAACKTSKARRDLVCGGGLPPALVEAYVADLIPKQSSTVFKWWSRIPSLEGFWHEVHMRALQGKTTLTVTVSVRAGAANVELALTDGPTVLIENDSSADYSSATVAEILPRETFLVVEGLETQLVRESDGPHFSYSVFAGDRVVAPRGGDGALLLAAIFGLSVFGYNEFYVKTEYFAKYYHYPPSPDGIHIVGFAASAITPTFFEDVVATTNIDSPVLAGGLIQLDNVYPGAVAHQLSFVMCDLSWDDSSSYGNSFIVCDPISAFCSEGLGSSKFKEVCDRHDATSVYVVIQSRPGRPAKRQRIDAHFTDLCIAPTHASLSVATPRGQRGAVYNVH